MQTSGSTRPGGAFIARLESSRACGGVCSATPRGPVCVYFDALDFSTPDRLDCLAALLADALERGWDFVQMSDLA